MTVLFGGGGTGGHLAPGIAVAEELQQRNSSVRCVFVGAGRAIEQQMLSGTGFESQALSARTLTLLKRRPLEFLRSNWQALLAARQLIRNYQPQAVIGLGGFASIPLVIAAAQADVPVLLLEQNAWPGRANRWLSHWFPICVTFEASQLWLPIQARVQVTGNPIRRFLQTAFQSPGLAPSQRAKQLLIMGGSQGSSSLNRDWLAVMQQLRPSMSEWKIFHQTGPADVEAVQSRYQQLHLDAVVQPFFADVASLYRSSRFIVCRAGATTLTELALAGLPAILAPFPFSADQHQTENARQFVLRNAALVVNQRDPIATQLDLQQAIESVLIDEQQLDTMSRAMRSLARPDAVSLVAEFITATICGIS